MMTGLLIHLGSGCRRFAVALGFALTGLAGAARAAESPMQEDPLIEPAAGASDHAVAAAQSGGLPQLDFATYAPQLAWMGIILLVLYIIMAKKALPQIGSAIEERKTLIDTDLQSAETTQAEVSNIREGYERGLDLARMQASSAVQEVEAAAKKKMSDEMDKFRARSHEQMAGTEAKIEAAKAKVMADMNGVAAEVASYAAEKITGIGTDMQKAKAIVDTIAGKAKAA